MADTKNVPEPDDPRKPEAPPQVTKPSWKYVLRTTMREFSNDGLTDLSAGLTYYAVLSIFPAVIALVSIFSLFGQDPRTIENLINELSGVIPAESMGTVTNAIEGLLTIQGAGLGLIVGILVALWSASNYVKAFGRAMNRIYEVPEGRPVWKFYAQMYLLTAVILVLITIAVMLVVLSGPVAQTVGDLIGLGSTALTVWSVVKWPVLLVIVVIVLALLYHFTPNVQQPKIRWLSIGALVAIVIAALASAGFGIYVANFSNYNKTYGALAGVIIFLFWLWIMNLAILFGAELDAELERGRELQAGIPAEKEVQLPPRDTTASDKKKAKEEEDIKRGVALRRSAGKTDDSSAADDAAGHGDDQRGQGEEDAATGDGSAHRGGSTRA